MRTSALVAFVALAVASPACAAPFNPVFARDAPAADASDDSGAISLKTVGTIGSIAAPLVGGVIDHFTGDQQQRRDAPGEGSDDDSGAISLKTVGTIGSIAAPLVGGIIDHFTGDQQQRRDSSMDSFQQAMQGDAQGSSAQTAAQMQQMQQQMRGAQQGPNQKVGARAEEDEDSGAISLKTLGTIGSVAAPLVGGIVDHFTGGDQQQRRELLSLLAREAGDDEDSGAISLKTLGTIGSVAAPLVGGIVDHFTGDQQQRRDTQASDDDDSGAISLKTIGTIGSAAAPLVGGIIDHFTGGDQQQRREILSLLAREAVDDEDSGAVSLKTLGNIGSIAASAAPLVGGIVDHFTGDQQQQRREAPGSDGDSGAISLKTVGTIGSIAAPLVGGIIDHFTGDQQRRGDTDVGSTYNPIHGSGGAWRIPPRPAFEGRDLLALLARATADDSESGAIFRAPGSFGPHGPFVHPPVDGFPKVAPAAQ
ncbi:hypothetical protein PsYK624_043330 [Phanerochaete sordida]|uniref:Uncharacterized protein n=1 Tax=Phanerochaete sordida TaxID=48140 RepID=A0A9P3G5K9_9APHY|nr:hypothetical protein PsYK624_043330 [Phanerochaete sordida]